MSSFLWTGGIPKPHSFFNHQHLHESLIWQRNQKPQVALPALRLHFGHKIFSFPLLVYKLGTQKKAVISLSGFSVCINSSSHATCTYYCIVCEKNTYLTVCWQVIRVSWLFAPGAFHSVAIHVWVVGGNYCMSGRFFRWKSAKQKTIKQCIEIVTRH